MPRTLAIFGAGPALGRSVARRFGREGFQVALVSRSRTRLDAAVADLRADDIQAAAFPADMHHPDDARRAVAQINTEVGPIDVLEYSPGAVDSVVVPALELDLQALEPALDLRLRTPVAVTQAVLPSMLKRGHGALLYAFGTQPRLPDPLIGNVGAAQAALLHHVYNLNASLRNSGVYAGALLIGGLIEGSEIHRMLSAGGASHLPPEAAEKEYPVVHPDTLADLYWDMYVKRDRVEEIVNAPAVEAAG